MASAPTTLLTSKSAIVTGGTRGIGKGISTELARRGANVAMVYMTASTKPTADSFAAELSSIYGVYAVAIQADLENAASFATIVEKALRLLDVKSIEIIINNAALGDWTSTPNITLSHYEKVMNINVRAPLFLVQAALPYIPRGGRIINISSFATRQMMIGPGVPDMTLYILSKIALEGMAQGWAVEFGHSRGITANCVSVGMVETDLIASMLEDVKETLRKQNGMMTAAEARTGTPDDVAQVVAFLASEGARWVTGSTVSTNGGFTVI